MNRPFSAVEDEVGDGAIAIYDTHGLLQRSIKVEIDIRYMAYHV